MQNLFKKEIPVEKIETKDFIKSNLPKLNGIEYKKSLYKFNISIQESNTILAYQIERGIKILEDSGEKRLAKVLTEKNRWVLGWRKYYDRFNEYWQHLKRVCDNCENDKKAPSAYPDKRLLGWDRQFADRAITNKRNILKYD